MQKVLRSLCMGIAVAFSAASFAQTNMTDKLLNPDAEKGMLGWDVTFVDGGQIWNKQTKGEEISAGYYGYDNWAFENWRSSSAALTDGSIFQVVKDLPNGTYVFGAYATATRDAWTPSIDQITGVSMFANENSVPVATHRVEGMDEKWAHAIKFNVAAAVTDGTLKVGIKTENTTASFVTMDNATLYYFEDMGLDEALAEMAKIDIATSVEKTSAFLNNEAGKMNADTLAYLQSVIEAAQGEVTLENAVQLNEDLYWGKRLAKRSVAAYAKLAAALEAAKETAGKQWSDVEETALALEALNELVTACDEKYNDGTALDGEVDDWVALLAEASTLVELDAYYLKAEEYYSALDTLTLGDEVGQYSYEDYDRAVGCYDEIMLILSDAFAGELSATTAQSQCEALLAKIQKIIDTPINYSEFPIFLHRCDTILPGQITDSRNQPWPVLDGAYVQDIPAGIDNNGKSYNALKDVCHYNSPLFRFKETLTKVRFIVHESGSPKQTAKDGRASFLLGSFTMYDETGEIIELSASNVVTNANEPKEGGGIPALFDGNPSTYFHSLWSGSTPQNHYIEVTLPEGTYSAFSFQMVALSNNHTRPFPAELEITYVSDLVTELQQAVVKAKTLAPMFGTAPGFTNMDPAAFEATIAECEAITEKEGALDSEVKAAIEKAKALIEQAENSFMMPDPTKKYRIVSGEPRFFTNQNIVKTLTLHTDTIYGDWLWWETAHPDSARQEFIVEPCESESNRLYYTFKHAETGLYLGELFDDAGNLVPNRFVFTERRDSFYLTNLGQGQFGIMASDGNSRKQLNMEFHNNGAWSEDVKNYGAISGVKSYIHTWGSSANQSSAWFFREMVTLPQAVRSISELNFRSAAMSIYEGVNNLTITADKECAFADLTITDVFGNKIALDQLSVEGNVATLQLAKPVETFSVIFTNAEGVEEVTVDGFYKSGGASAAYTALQNAYNAASALAPVEGTEVGQVADLTEYNVALAAAEELLINGAEEAELEEAKAELEAAQAGLEYNLPKEGVEYLMLIGLDAIKNNHLTDMAIFADASQNAPRWTYVSLTNNDFRWKFINCGELKHGRNAYYLQNVGTGLYPAITAENSPMTLVSDTTMTRPFDIHFMNNGKVSLGDSFWNNGQQCFHPMNHASGAAANKGGYMISYKKEDPASVVFVVEADKYITDVIFSINDIEEIEAADEVAPAVKGIFDLFGRRIETPAATGIYIVDGKKTVIKK